MDVMGSTGNTVGRVSTLSGLSAPGARSAETGAPRVPHTAAHRDALLCRLPFAILIAATWVVLASWQALPWSGALAAFPGALAFTISWLLMSIAMMLPASLALMRHPPLVARSRCRYVHRAGCDAIFVAGYLATWTAFGLLIFVAEATLAWALARAPAMDAHLGLLVVLTPVAAGAYQFTPAKRRYLERCPAPQLSSHDPSEPGPWETPMAAQWRLGLRYGGWCVGSCWALMLLMVVGGDMRLPVMLFLGGIMTVERIGHGRPWVTWISDALGIALLLWAQLSVAGLLPFPA